MALVKKIQMHVFLRRVFQKQKFDNCLRKLHKRRRDTSALEIQVLWNWREKTEPFNFGKQDG